MHLDHEHTHAHTHENGETHTHAHTHEGGHAHTHGCGGHIHCGEHHDCASCGQDPRQEIVALMRYMVGHNTQHASELAGLAKKLEELGDRASYEQVMQAVSDFEKGNLRLSAVLAALDQK